MVVFFLTDCMSINEEVPEALRYPDIVRQHFIDLQIHVIGLSGATTNEALEQVRKVSDCHPDVVVYAFGINDALPRGLKRAQRAKLIRTMYKVQMTKALRLAFRTYLLNPLEYVMQHVGKPKHYATDRQMIDNIDHCMKLFKDEGMSSIIINLNPVLNYRFVHANEHIARYNDAIKVYCEENDIAVVDAFSLFYKIGLPKALASDRFHYSKEAHRAVADKLIAIIQKMKE